MWGTFDTEQLRPAVLRIQVLGFWCTAEKETEGDSDRNRWRRTHRGMRVRYVNTLAKASSGMSLKAEHSGRVMMTLESSPRPPRKKKKKKAINYQYVMALFLGRG